MQLATLSRIARSAATTVGGFAAVGFALAIFLAPGVARAHFDLLQPPPADNATDGGKGAPPCGPTTASNVVTSVQGGHPLAISISETVMHPGHYRFALSVNARSELPADPTVVVQGSLSVSAAFENPAVFPVLADDVFDHTTGTAPIAWQTSLTLPNITCTKCTLQVIEFMAEHGANPGGGYFYHHCADLKITADPNLPAADGGVPDSGVGGGPAGAGGAGAGGRSGGTGGAPAGSGGAPAGSGGAPAGTGGAPAGTGGALAGTGGAPAGSGGAPAGTDAGQSATGGSTDAGQHKSSGGGGCAIAGSLNTGAGSLALLCIALVLATRRRRPR